MLSRDIANKWTPTLQANSCVLDMEHSIQGKFFISSWPGEDHAYNLARPSAGDSMFAATTSMGYLSLAASALDSSQDRVTYEDDVFTRAPQDRVTYEDDVFTKAPQDRVTYEDDVFTRAPQDRPNYEYNLFASTPKPVREEARIPQGRPYYKDNIFASTPEPAKEEPSEEKIVKRKRESGTEGKKTEKRPETYRRSEKPPKETRSGKRQTGKQVRGNIDRIYDGRKQL